MAKKVVSDLDLNQNELQNAVTQNLASAPATPKAGQSYFNTATNHFMGYNGTSWLALDGQGQVYTFSTGLTESSGTVTLNQATGSALGGVIVGSHLAVSSGTISVDEASTSQKGVIEIATDTEASTGTDTTRAINAKQLATKVTSNTAITGATHTKITYDSKGLVTGGEDLSASDIPNLTLSKITDVTASASELNVLDGITATTAELNILDGVTATATELNVLDGITASTTELNYVDGVTSSIQTQLNNKVASNAAITGATHTKITYDSKGLVTGGSSLSASDIPDISATYVTTASKGQANGVASLGSDGKVPSAQLPSFVDDVIDAYIVSGSTALSAGWLSKTDGGSALTPETGVIYVVLTSGEYLNKTYRWSGTTYVEISSAPGQATESTAGIAAIATNSECDTGTNDTKIVTPYKLAHYTQGMATKTNWTNPALTATSGVCTWTISAYKSPNCICAIRETSSGAEVLCDVTYGNASITVKINSSSNIAANTYTATVIG